MAHWNDHITHIICLTIKAVVIYMKVKVKMKWFFDGLVGDRRVKSYLLRLSLGWKCHEKKICCVGKSWENYFTGMSSR